MQIADQAASRPLPAEARRVPPVWIGLVWLLASILLVGALMVSGRAASSRALDDRAKALDVRIGTSLEGLRSADARVDDRGAQLEEARQRLAESRMRLDRRDRKLQGLRHDIRVERRRIAAEAAAAAAAAAAIQVPPRPVAPPIHYEIPDHCQLGCD